MHWLNLPDNHVSEIITEYGLCISFNIAEHHEVLLSNVTSTDFHYDVVQYPKSRPTTYVHKPPRNATASNIGLVYHFQSPNFFERNQTFIGTDIAGHLVMVHDPYEIPSHDTVKIPLTFLTYLNFWIEPELNEVEESMSYFNSYE